MSCKHKDTCELFPQFALKSSLRIWQIRFCDTKDRYNECARFQQSSAGKPVPITLLPNGKELNVLGGKS